VQARAETGEETAARPRPATALTPHARGVGPRRAADPDRSNRPGRDGPEDRVRRRARLGRRSRAAVLSGLVFFVAGQVAFRAALARRPALGDVEFGRKLDGLEARLATVSPGVGRGPAGPLVVMLGSSRVATGFRPDALPRLVGPDGREAVAFNFAQVGTGPQIAHLVLHRLLARGVRPDWVVVEFWPPFWASDGYLQGYLDSLNLAALDWPAVRLLARYLPRPGRLYARWLPAQAVPVSASRSALLSRLGPSWAPGFDPDRRLDGVDGSGWWAPRISVSDDDRRRLVAHYRGIYADRLARFRPRPTPDRALRDLLALARREGIGVAVAVLPEGAEFRALYPPESLAAVADYLRDLAREVPVIDARDWVADPGFADGHHLLPDGASTFTARFGRETLAPLVRAGPPARR